MRLKFSIAFFYTPPMCKYINSEVKTYHVLYVLCECSNAAINALGSDLT